MLELDLNTMIIMTILISIFSVVSLFFLWLLQSRRKGTGFWVIGMLCIAIGNLLIYGIGNISDCLSLFVGDLFYILGFLLILRGIRIFVGQSPLRSLDFSLPPLMVVLFYYLSCGSQNVNVRVATISLVLMVICFIIVITFVRDKKTPWLFVGLAGCAVFGSFGVFQGIRGGISLFYYFGYELLPHEILLSVYFLGGTFILSGSSIALILLLYVSLKSELEIYFFAVNQSDSSIIITDRAGLIEYVNPACQKKTGYLLKDLIGKNPRIFSSGEMDKKGYASLWKSLSTGNAWHGEFHNRKKNGDFFWELASIAPVKQKNNKISHYIAIKQDITELKHAKKQILYMANHDALTGLAMRQFFQDRLIKALADAKLNKQKIAVLFLDLDGFKKVNDSFGHHTGDFVLKEVAIRLTESVREIDTVGRIGGDEFCILLTNIKDQESTITISEKLIKIIDKPYKYKNESIDIGVSIGIALYPDHADTPEKLVELADKAMYTIKRKGRNNYALTTDAQSFAVTKSAEELDSFVR
ncbi:PAS/PAC sensors-containing diguanylate cyclase/phosphodiesterase [Psychromonas sp. CNPT3]|uniref:sensor domain-containing protein n=1 Tax=Psychromonas sp. CNPT3 TaxID=314282 RepID=UPI00006E70D8|nr:diguanylate cyclase [Psychromonas sp. CNPT3]AGH81453.1 PAS/PAC sensors-containing diguanylate cyclase/phosphodiesterase [Psychromonas sp. CNPT3]